jgi:hypothetical protein
LILGEHRLLEGWTVDAVLIHERTCDRLNDPVDVNGLAACVRPETHVDLFGLEESVDFGLEESVDDSSCEHQQRTKLRGLRLGQPGHAGHMTPRLDDERRNTEWPDAVLHQPQRRRVNDSTGEREPAGSEVAGKTANHAV